MGHEVQGKREITAEKLRRNIYCAISRIGQVTETEVTDDLDLSDLGIDSLGKLELIAEVEASFSVSISDAEAFEVKSAMDLQNLVLSHAN